MTKLTNIESITPIVREIENLFSILNELCYGGELESPIIIIAPNTRKTSCLSKAESTKERVWKDTDKGSSNVGRYEIKLSAHVLDRTKEEICAILLHEMAHLHCAIAGKKDTNQNGSYHNKVYKETAEKHGLCLAEKDAKYGWNNTVLAVSTKESLKAELEKQGLSLDSRFEIYRPVSPVASKKTASHKSGSKKYVCQVIGCKETVRGTKNSNIKCGIHDRKMVLEDDPKAHSLKPKEPNGKEALGKHRHKNASAA